MNSESAMPTLQNEKIYFFDKESDYATLLENELAGFNIAARHLPDLEEGLVEIKKCPPDLLMFDPVWLGRGNIEIIRKLRTIEELKTIPFLICSDSIPEDEILSGFDLGGDDYLPKPVQIGEAVSRIRALLRRKKMAFARVDQEEFSSGTVYMNLNTREVRRKGNIFKLTSTETKILKELSRNPGTVCRRSHLIEMVWPENRIVEEQNLDVHISSLRKKIEENPSLPRIIVTIRSVGFKLNL